MSNKIEIFVACHKPSVLPKNDYFVPIHVGAAKSKILMEKMLRDDQGENISEKNPQYCEMTAQYWAWKHSNADYIGLCHYRRFLSFSDKEFDNLTADNRGHVAIPILSETTLMKYGLEDKIALEKYITDNDIIVPKAQDLSKVYTPLGWQPTVLKHWLAHDRALINVEDLNTMFEIVKANYPQIYHSMKEYLDGKYFYGFNTFVMRRDLFNEMCTFEFDVLAKLEQKVDISNYNQQLSRIYGFMGEILFSSFVHYIKNSRSDVKVKECQMLFFDQTDPVSEIIPRSKDSIKIVIDLLNVPTFLLATVLHSLLQNTTSDREYEIVVLGERFDSYMKKFFGTWCLDNPKITLLFKSVVNFSVNVKEMLPTVNINLSMYSSLFLAWLLPAWDKCLYLKWNTLIEKPIDEYYDHVFEMGKTFTAVYDVYFQGRLNTFKKDDFIYNSEKLGLKNVFTVYNPDVLFVNLKKQRLCYDFKVVINDILELFSVEKNRRPTEVELFNILYSNDIAVMKQEMNSFANTNNDINFYINESPLWANRLYKEGLKAPVIIRYDCDAIWQCGTDIEFYLKIWKIIAQTGIIECYYDHRLYRRQVVCGRFVYPYTDRKILAILIDKLLPANSRRRNFVRGKISVDGFLYRLIKKFY